MACDFSSTEEKKNKNKTRKQTNLPVENIVLSKTYPSLMKNR
jgi:hypothetical protein